MLRASGPAFVLILALMPAWAAAGVSVRRAEPSVKYRTFDPARPPADMPRFSPNEAAVTVCGFGFSAEPQYDVLSRQRGADGNWTVTVAVTNVSVFVRLTIVVWTPKGVSDKLKAHEEGHRKLDEMMYKRLADPAAQSAGEEMDGHQFTGTGATAAAAEADAIKGMFRQAGRDYLAASADINERVNADYDAITRHGTDPIPEADAIKQALDHYERDHPSDPSAK